MKSVSQNDFAPLVKDNQFVVLKFTAPWCAPCRALTPMLETMSQEFSQIAFAEVNVDDSPALAAQFNIRNVPTMIGFKDGVVQWMKVGLPAPSDLRQTLQGLVA